MFVDILMGYFMHCVRSFNLTKPRVNVLTPTHRTESGWLVGLIVSVGPAPGVIVPPVNTAPGCAPRAVSLYVGRL